MTSPFTGEAALQVRRIYEAAEAQLLRSIARRVASGIDSPTWEAEKLSDLLRVRAELERQIAQHARTAGTAVGAAVTEAGIAGAAQAVAEAGRIGRTLGIGGNRPAIRALSQEAVSTVLSTTPRILRVTQDIYRDAVVEAAGTVLTGAQTRRQAAQIVLDRFATRGVTGFIDTAGRSWDAATYAEMATRTAVANASRFGHEDTLRAAGFDLVIVSWSLRPCEQCDPWEGTILTMGATTAQYPSVASAREEGLFHPNCRHRLGLYTPGLTREPIRKASPAVLQQRYAEEQQQRYNERKIREWKRREAVAITPEAEAYTRGKIREWQAVQRDHLAGTDLRRKYEREQIVRAR